jgi:hypothetical protein
VFDLNPLIACQASLRFAFFSTSIADKRTVNALTRTRLAKASAGKHLVLTSVETLTTSCRGIQNGRAAHACFITIWGTQ